MKARGPACLVCRKPLAFAEPVVGLVVGALDGDDTFRAPMGLTNARGLVHSRCVERRLIGAPAVVALAREDLSRGIDFAGVSHPPSRERRHAPTALRCGVCRRLLHEPEVVYALVLMKLDSRRPAAFRRLLLYAHAACVLGGPIRVRGKQTQP